MATFIVATRILPQRKNSQVIGGGDMLCLEIENLCKISNGASLVLIYLLFLLTSVTADNLCWPLDYGQQGVLKKKIWVALLRKQGEGGRGRRRGISMEKTNITKTWVCWFSAGLYAKPGNLKSQAAFTEFLSISSILLIVRGSSHSCLCDKAYKQIGQGVRLAMKYDKLTAKAATALVTDTSFRSYHVSGCFV